ncbi:hypothetical protein Ahy_A09g043768 [Arachis hypogaea]|uniref:Uncharacterized protein n=1 Tax=Arachis hypogaea TaxID=3818 RepID=A0A445BIY2_ARAHY|nr:hypothetical protein Ahy_A09g043768 [Arachis hypogaea]
MDLSNALIYGDRLRCGSSEIANATLEFSNLKYGLTWLEDVYQLFYYQQRKRFQIDNNIEMPELCPEWLALLIIEKACLSSISLYETSGAVCKTGQNFKEKLRELGGLDAVFEITLKCQSDLKAHFLGLKWNLIPQAIVELILTIIKFLSVLLTERKELLKTQLVGKSGVTPNVATSFIETLEANELLKDQKTAMAKASKACAFLRRCPSLTLGSILEEIASILPGHEFASVSDIQLNSSS